MRVPNYDGPAELFSTHGELLARVKVHLETGPPQGPVAGSWKGTVSAEPGTELGAKVNLGAVIMRLPDRRTARAVMTERPPDPVRSVALVGSGAPPY